MNVVEPRKSRMVQAVSASQLDLIAAAEQKLGRLLTDTERQGIQHIRSLMLLEAYYRAFSALPTTPAEVLIDLEKLAKQAQ